MRGVLAATPLDGIGGSVVAKQAPTDLRELLAAVIAAVQMAWYTDDRKPADGEGLPEELADAVLAVFAEHLEDALDAYKAGYGAAMLKAAERERLLRELPYQQGYMDAKRELRERIEALTAPYSANDIDSGHRRSREHYERAVRDVLGVFDDQS